MINIMREDIFHVGYFVSDIKAAAKRMERIYGLSGFVYTDYRPKRAWIRGVEADYRVLLAYSNPDTRVRIELVQPVTEGPVMDIFRRASNAIIHTGHTVVEYEKYRDLFLERGCELLIEAEMEDEKVGYRRSCYTYDPFFKSIFEVSEVPRKK